MKPGTMVPLKIVYPTRHLPRVSLLILAVALLGLCSADWTSDRCVYDRDGDVVDGPGRCWVVAADDEDYDPPTTCAECTTDSECDALCGVKACTAEGQRGCWMPDDFNHPTTRTWWKGDDR
jgi:hypothetical protein